jgi:hypothetical protein
MNTSYSIMGVVLTASTLALCGCTVEAGAPSTPEEAVGNTAEAIGPECAAATATQTFVSEIHYTSPKTYDTQDCYKAVVVDLSNYASTMPHGDIADTTVTWADTVPGTKTVCNSTWVRADLFQKINGMWIYKGTKESQGWWSTGGFSFPVGCQTPGVDFATEMTQHNTYRIAATARTDNTSNAPTRKLRINTSYTIPPSIH